MYDLVDFCFDGGGINCITVTKYGAKLISDPFTYLISFNRKAFIKAVKYVTSVTHT